MVLLFCLVILVILLAGGVAVMRSMNSSLFSAGNLAFKRDLVNQGELAISKAMQAFKTGGLATSTLTSSNVPADNYSAVQLKANANSASPTCCSRRPVSPARTSATPIHAHRRRHHGGNGGVTVHYVIDRMCNASGSFATLGNSGCVSPVERRKSPAAPPAAAAGPSGSPPSIALSIASTDRATRRSSCKLVLKARVTQQSISMKTKSSPSVRRVATGGTGIGAGPRLGAP